MSSSNEETLPNVQPTAASPQNLTTHQTLDIHTITALIGRDNLDVSLGDLGLHHEAHDDVLNIYAVIRQLELENTKEEDVAEQMVEEELDIGKNAVFRFGKRWVFLNHIMQLTEGIAVKLFANSQGIRMFPVLAENFRFAV